LTRASSYVVVAAHSQHSVLFPRTRAAIAALERRADERKQNFLQELTKQLEENERRLASLRPKEAEARLHAPVSGTVQQLMEIV
jgi:hypothetical protein